MTDSTHRNSGIITSNEALAHYDEIALMYEELRAAIDGGHESMTHADALAEIAAIRAENAALQQGYDAARHLRGVTKSKLLAQPVAWMVYLPSIDTQHLYYSQEDMGYVDDVTNHADAEVTPLYEMAAPKAEVAHSGEYPPLPSASLWRDETGIRGYDTDPGTGPWYTAALLHAYVDADRAMRAKAASTTDSYVQPVPDKCDRIVWRGNYYHLPLTPPAQEADSQPAEVLTSETGGDWTQPTTVALRLGDAMQLLCGGKRPPDDMVQQWLDNTSESLQEFAASNGPAWAQGIGLIDAALVMVDQPTEITAIDNPDRDHEHRAARAPADSVLEDAARWQTFIALPYATRAEWVSNLSLAPVLTQWVDTARNQGGLP